MFVLVLVVIVAVVMVVNMAMWMLVLIVVRVAVARQMRVGMGRTAHFAPFSPRIMIFSNSESEPRMAVVLSSKIFLYASRVRSSL